MYQKRTENIPADMDHNPRPDFVKKSELQANPVESAKGLASGLLLTYLKTGNFSKTVTKPYFKKNLTLKNTCWLSGISKDLFAFIEIFLELFEHMIDQPLKNFHVISMIF